MRENTDQNNSEYRHFLRSVDVTKKAVGFSIHVLFGDTLRKWYLAQKHFRVALISQVEISRKFI